MRGSARSTCHLGDVKALSPEGNLYPPVFPSPSVLNPLQSESLSFLSTSLWWICRDIWIKLPCQQPVITGSFYNQYYDNLCKISQSIWICVHFHTGTIALQVKKNANLFHILRPFHAVWKAWFFLPFFGVNSRTWLLWMIEERLVTWKEVPWFSGVFFPWQESAWSESQRTLFRKVSR